MAAKALSAGAKTVMSSVVLSVSPRLAAPTAVTRVERAGLLEAAVATGSLAMPSKLPAPSAGTLAQAGPKAPSIIAALGLGAIDSGAIDSGAIDSGAIDSGAMDGAVLAPLPLQAATRAPVTRSPPRARVQFGVFTVALLVVTHCGLGRVL